jgi:hypothetical protein
MIDFARLRLRSDVTVERLGVDPQPKRNARLLKRKRQSVRPQSPPPERWTIDQAYQRLLEHFKKPHLARHELGEAVRAGKVQLWGCQSDKLWFAVKPDFFEGHLQVATHEKPEGWHATLEMRAAVQDFDKTEWAVSAKEIHALCRPPVTDEGKRAKRGPKPYDWDLFHVQCIRFLDTDDVGAYEDVGISALAKRLLEWGDEHLGEEDTPEISAMSANVSAWVKTWQRLRTLEN